jgi:hypothetical protein
MPLRSPIRVPKPCGAGRAQRGRPVGRNAPAPAHDLPTTRPVRAADHGQIGLRFSGFFFLILLRLGYRRKVEAKKLGFLRL